MERISSHPPRQLVRCGECVGEKDLCGPRFEEVVGERELCGPSDVGGKGGPWEALENLVQGTK